MGLFNFFGGGNKDTDNITDYLQKGAVVLDVRTPAEWAEGHVKGSELITLNEIQQNIDKIKSWNKPLVVVCRSGGRVSSILPFLKNEGIDAINGGAWQNADK